MKPRSRNVHNDTRPVAVLKLGGSVLTDVGAYRRAAEALAARVAAAPYEDLVVVVSAQCGETDRLRALAREFSAAPAQPALDLLWSTGELRSAALLTMALQAEDVAAVGLSVHECGLHFGEAGAAGERVWLNPIWIRHALSAHRVVVVPGFLARGPADEVVSLGRGGSDLSAVVLAAGLNAVRCELIKDVPGYFSKDPNRHTDAEPLAQVDYATALAMAHEGCELVQERALAEAARHGVVVVVRSLEADAPRTIVSETRAAALAAG
jgi:aspartate kinase